MNPHSNATTANSQAHGTTIRDVVIGSAPTRVDIRISSAGEITEVEPTSSFPGDSAFIIEGGGAIAVPGFVDLQVNGSSGFDLTTQPDAVWKVATALVGHGVTAFLPTVVSASLDRVEELDCVLSDGPPEGFAGAEPLGIHVEGPFIAPDARGAHPAESLLLPTAANCERLIRLSQVRLVTLAPELDGAIAAIAALTEAGIAVAIGHSQASEQQTRDAIAAGASLATHIPNAMAPISGRGLGVAGTVLDDEGMAISVIADGEHVHDGFVRLMWRLKGPDRFILVSDAIAAQGLPDGNFTLGGTQIEVSNAVARTPAGGLAGSTITLDAAIRNLIEITGCPLDDALAAVSSTPLQTISERSRIGVIEPLQPADIALLDDNLAPVMTLIGGVVVFNREQ